MRVLSIICALGCFMLCSKGLGAALDRYELYPTKNIWTFLKLDTETGKLQHVQFSIKPEQPRLEYVLSEIDIPALTGKPHVPGRYKLYPTQNQWNFLLLDKIDGEVFQVQWGESCMVIPIRPGVAAGKSTDEKPNEKPKAEDD